MDKLLLKQEDMLEHLNKAFSNYKKTPSERRKVSYIESRIEILEKLFENFTKIHSEILESINREEKALMPYFTEDVYYQFEDAYTDYKTKLKDDLRTYGVAASSSQIAQHDVSIPSSTKVKLPQIQLPKFSGLYEEWQTFFDMFTSLIHHNAALTGVQKLHYLKSSLIGEPDTLLKNFATTDTNYEEAFKQLTRRYNNKRYNCNEIMKRLFSQRNAIDSASSIKQLLDITSTSLKSLANMGIITSSWDVIVNYLVVSRLDQESRKLWQIQVSQLETDELPTWNQLVKFLETRFRTLEMINDNKPATKSHNTHIDITPKAFHSTSQEYKQSNIICTMCNSQHLLYQCKQFGKQSPEERSEFVQSKRLCFNCLAPTHSVKDCRSSACCHRCGRRHHTLFHFERAKLQDSTAIESTRDERVAKYTPNQEPRHIIENHVVAHLVTQSNEREMLLATAVVKAYSTDGYSQVVRVLIDPCSEGSFITESTAQSLGLKQASINGLVSGIGDSKTRSRSMVSLSMKSIHNPKYSIKFDAYVLSKLTSFLPTCQTKITDWLDIERVKLADPDYGSPSKVDIILGVEVYEEIILPGFMKHPSRKGPIAQETRLGWILSGRVRHEPSSTNIEVNNFHLQIRDDKLSKQFWEIEREPDKILKTFTKEKIRYDEIFEPIISRDNEVCCDDQLPFENSKQNYIEGRSREIALRRFKLIAHPRRQQVVPHVLTRWRRHTISTLADHVQIYRQVRVQTQDTDAQRIMWRPEPNISIEQCQVLSRHLFGRACAPYLAVKALQQLRKGEESRYTRVSKITRPELHIDNHLTGCETESEAIHILKKLDNESLHLPEIAEIVIKRKVLSESIRFYNSLSWIVPVNLSSKIFIQKLCKFILSWNDNLTHNFTKDLCLYRENFYNAKNIIIPRWLKLLHIHSVELPSFTDILQVSYAKICNMRNEFGCTSDNRVTKTIFRSVQKEKSKLQLKLCAAILAFESILNYRALTIFLNYLQS